MQFVNSLFRNYNPNLPGLKALGSMAYTYLRAFQYLSDLGILYQKFHYSTSFTSMHVYTSRDQDDNEYKS
jgi:hypothetical protein